MKGGKWIRRIDAGHNCSSNWPMLQDAGVGSLWRCDCGRKWEIVYGDGYCGKEWSEA